MQEHGPAAEKAPQTNFAEKPPADSQNSKPVRGLDGLIGVLPYLSGSFKKLLAPITNPFINNKIASFHT